MANEKFVSASYPWYSGVGQGVELFGPTLALKSGHSIGTYTTIVYESHSLKTSVSWEIEEEGQGEVNTIAQQIPPTIEMRASDVSPLGRTVTLISNTLVATSAVRMGKVGDVYYGLPTSTLSVDYGFGGGQWRMAIGLPKRYEYTDSAQVFGTHWIVEPGLSIVPIFNDYNYCGGQWRMAIGAPITYTQADAGNIVSGQLVVEGGVIQ